MHQGLHYFDMACRSILHQIMPRYCVILVVFLRPLVGYWSTLRRHCLQKCWFYVSLGSVSKSWSNTSWHITFCMIGHHTCAPQNFLFQKQIRCPSWMQIDSIRKSLTSMWISNGLVKFWNFNTRANEKILSHLQLPFVVSLSIQKKTLFWRDPKVILPSMKIFWWTFNRCSPSLGMIKFLWLWLIFSNLLWLVTFYN